MKKKVINSSIALVVTLGSTFLIGCGGTDTAGQKESETRTTEGHEGQDEHSEHAHYACPMDCEHGKIYDEPGKCPECNMDMVQISEENAHADEAEAHDHEHEFACPMHPEETGHEGDKCGKCGMALEKVAE